MDARLEAERASRDTDHRENQAQMFQMMRDMMTMTGGIQAQKVEDKERRAQEEMAEKERQLRERDEGILRQEGRMDTAYDRALDYTTHNNMPPQTPQQVAPAQPEQQAPRPQQAQTPQAPAAKTVTSTLCPDCGASLEPGMKFCADCGASI